MENYFGTLSKTLSGHRPQQPAKPSATAGQTRLLKRIEASKITIAQQRGEIVRLKEALARVKDLIADLE